MGYRTTATGVETFHYLKGRGWSGPFPSLDSDRTLVLVFGSRPMAGDAAVAELLAAYPSSHIVGCSTSGEIAGPALLDDSLSVAVMRMEHTRIATASAPVRSASDSFLAGDVLARQLEGPALRGVLVFSCGIGVNGSELVRGLRARLDPGVTLAGGLAGDGDRFERTWVLHNGRAREGCVAAVGLSGDRLRIACGSGGGWDAFGPERLVTRSEGNVLFELDGRPVLPLYKEYLGDRAADLPASAMLFPLLVESDVESDPRRGPDDAPTRRRRLVRTIVGVDEARQALVFAGDVPTGATAYLTRSSMEGLMGEAAAAAESSASAVASGGAALSLVVNCVGRRLMMGERAEEELERTHAALPPGARQVGFYSYGEIGPGFDGGCSLHNQTILITTITEA